MMILYIQPNQAAMHSEFVYKVNLPWKESRWMHKAYGDKRDCTIFKVVGRYKIENSDEYAVLYKRKEGSPCIYMLMEKEFNEKFVKAPY